MCLLKPNHHDGHYIVFHDAQHLMLTLCSFGVFVCCAFVTVSCYLLDLNLDEAHHAVRCS
jgi:hypothetical protein